LNDDHSWFIYLGNHEFAGGGGGERLSKARSDANETDIIIIIIAVHNHCMQQCAMAAAARPKNLAWSHAQTM
jgi:hypothetical protein